MSEKREGLGRRDFLKLGLIGGVAIGGFKLIDAVSRAQTDLSNPDNFKEFVGKEVYPAYFRGKVYVREGAAIHEEPTMWSEEESGGLITTRKNPDTQIAEVKTGDEFVVRNPLLVFQEAEEGEGGAFIKAIKTPEGDRVNINTMGSWVVFGLGLVEKAPDYIKGDIRRAEHDVGCVNFQDLAFEPQGGKVQFSFPQDSIEYRQEIDLGL